MEGKLQVDIVTPKEMVFTGYADSVTLPGSKSSFEVLKDHAPLVSSLDIGHIKISANGTLENVFATSEGFVEISDNKVSVIVEDASSAKDDHVDVVTKEIASLQQQLADPDKGGNIQTVRDIEMLENRLSAIDKYNSGK
jgi:F-type H+-transporting ATPase subunit epsilon